MISLPLKFEPARIYLKIIFLAMLLAIVPRPAPAGVSVPAPLDHLILKGKQQIYELKFREAVRTFERAQKEFPEYPHGFVYQAYITAIIYGLDQSNDSLAQRLEDQLNKSMEVARSYKDRKKDNAGSYFHLGLANSIKAMYHIIDRSYIKGYWTGRKAKNHLEKVVELDSTYYDAYIGLGLFHYYADLLPGVLKFIAGILGFEGDRIKGKQEINLTARRGHYFQVEGKFINHSIEYFLEGEKESAFRAFREMYQTYPTNQGLALMIAYHYRRTGYPQKCIEYCKNMADDYHSLLPQITNMKYYNLAVSNYDLNRFEKADSLFNVLNELPTRKSKYYHAAIAYYKGHLADLRFDRETAVQFYEKIKKHKQTEYWYWRSKALKKHPTDSLMYTYFVASNLMDNRKFQASLNKVMELRAAYLNGSESVNPNFRFYLWDILGKYYYYQNNLAHSKTVFEQIVPELNEMDDEFRRAWIYIHYARCLRKLGYLKATAEMLDKANDLDEDYTRLIVEREKFVLRKIVRQQQEHREQMEVGE